MADAKLRIPVVVENVWHDLIPFAEGFFQT